MRLFFNLTVKMRPIKVPSGKLQTIGFAKMKRMLESHRFYQPTIDTRVSIVEYRSTNTSRLPDKHTLRRIGIVSLDRLLFQRFTIADIFLCVNSTSSLFNNIVGSMFISKLMGNLLY